MKNGFGDITAHFSVTFLFSGVLMILTTLMPSLTAAEDIDIYKNRSCPAENIGEYRFIFVVDNSGSMQRAEFTQSKETIDASIEYVIEKMPEAEVAVVQYGTDGFNGQAQHEYDVSVPFTKDPTVATNWSRQFGHGSPNYNHIQDHTPGSLSAMRLDNVYAAGGSLDISDAEVVQFVFFTDSLRDRVECCTSLVAYHNVTDDVYPGFGEYDALKNGSVLPGGIEAQFTVLSNAQKFSDGMAAAAAIASVGGSFTGEIEANESDPDGSGLSPRRLISGSFSAKNDVPKILNLLDGVIEEITLPPVSTSDSFAQASIDINRASFSSDNRAFFSLFAPSDARSWQGNIKGYFINSSGLTDTQGLAATTTSGSNVSFRTNAQSFWSATPDGPDVLAGGANEQIVSAGSRTLYTHLGTEPVSGTLSEELVTTNTNITTAHLNVGTDTQRATTLDWLQNAPMGDSLHSQPVLVRYESKSVLYAATNQGLLHAIDATDPITNGVTTGGEELWGFVPKELLPNLALLGGEQFPGAHIYGLDGKITRWHDDINKDGIVNDADTVLLVFGQRRGGQHYFALDVTDPLSPAFKWQITGGVTTGFEDLMQTWSKPALITVAHTGIAATAFSAQDTQRVLAFTGGYDALALDDKNNAVRAGGGGIYIVDRTGSLLWKTEDDMEYSMPADITAIDSNDDSLADRIYAVDLGGQIWRVDLADMSNATTSTVSRLASVSDNGYQPFFYPPSVSLIRSGGEKFLSISVGSGDRTNPLNGSVQNYMYMFKDRDVDIGPRTNSNNTLLTSDLYDITSFELGSSTDSARQSAKETLDASDGWVLKLAPGEMVLAGIRVVEGVLLATTFRPVFNGDPNVCETSITTESRLYSMDAATGNPVFNDNAELENDETLLTHHNRSVIIAGDGILNSAQPVFTEDGNAIQILLGKELESEIDQNLVTVFWFGR